ncbi:hypothetical protein [Bacillus thuringiensis]|uniref:hypothetical protein n=1 Tax=Bacillus thuringiensis TaxID=1428 RepID=UPI000BFE4C8A|nr:hypothetical protein [Bacillus thuringiensis]PGM06339.1 hypothetical protein CN938_23535 [Bacillus thuringiensis]
MLKKLVVGVLATGIALTGGMGASAASMEKPEGPVNSLKAAKCELPSHIKKLSNGKFEQYVKRTDNYYTEPLCGGTMHWYFKGKAPDGYSRYEGHLIL